MVSRQQENTDHSYGNSNAASPPNYFEDISNIQMLEENPPGHYVRPAVYGEEDNQFRGGEDNQFRMFCEYCDMNPNNANFCPNCMKKGDDGENGRIGLRGGAGNRPISPSSLQQRQRSIPIAEFMQRSTAIRFSKHMLFSNKSSSSEGSPRETFYCHICFENVSIEEVFILNCEHSFCLDCLNGYLTHGIKEGKTFFSCFHPTEGEDVCGENISEYVIKNIVPSEVFEKYLRFQQIMNNPCTRECPFCKTQQVGSIEALNMSCQNCKHEFCFLHSNSHTGMTCAEFEKKMHDEFTLTEAKLNEMSKPCPKCGCRISKNGGCNHMTCNVCKTDFCWLCMKIIPDVTAHFASGTPCDQFDVLHDDIYYDPEDPCTYVEQYAVLGIEYLIIAPAFCFAIPMAMIVYIFSLIGIYCCCEEEDISFQEIFRDCHGDSRDCFREIIIEIMFLPIFLFLFPFFMTWFILECTFEFSYCIVFFLFCCPEGWREPCEDDEIEF